MKIVGRLDRYIARRSIFPAKQAQSRGKLDGYLHLSERDFYLGATLQGFWGRRL